MSTSAEQELLDSPPAGPAPSGTTGRRLVEWLLRAIAILALAGLLVLAIRAPHSRPHATAAGDEIQEALARWSTRTMPAAAHVVFPEPPTPELRDWLAALPATGTAVSWSGAAPLPSAVAIEPVADPLRLAHIWVAAPAGRAVTLEDRLGILGRVVPAGFGARVTVPRLEGEVRAIIGAPVAEPAGEPAGATGEGTPTDPATAEGVAGTMTKAAPDDVVYGYGAATATPSATAATAALRDSLILRPLLLLAEAGWEAKFVMAALEERGWRVHARLALGPGGDLQQGPATLRLDTANYAAVIALDSVAARVAPELRRYVRDGGGLVAAGEAAALGALERLLPASAGAAPTEPSPFPTDSEGAPRQALALTPLDRLAPDAVALEHRGPEVAVAAWRVGAGRVVQVGYHDTWRWRMAAPNPDAVEEHRDWWSRLVSGVAYAPRVELPVAKRMEPTPLASLVAALGPAVDVTSHQEGGLWGDPRLFTWLLATAIAALILEWGSRRLRGER